MKPLTKFEWETGREWRFRLTSDFTVRLYTGWVGFHEFYDGDKLWAVLRDDELTVKSGYAWNGASPCWRVFGKWVGTPTPPSARIPSLIHDLFFQFLDVPCAPWDMKQANDIFFNLMRDGDFPLKGTYHGAVAIFGGIYRKLTVPSATVSCYEHGCDH